MVKKHNAKHAIVGNASCQFTLYALVKDWAVIQEEGVPAITPHLVVYIAACAIIDIIKRVKHRQLSTTEAKPLLLNAVGRWQALHKAQYGTQYIRPKHFWMWLISSRIDSAEWLFDMFYIERQHQRVRP